jgi:hypothetical protein
MVACAAFPRAKISAKEPFFGGALTSGAAAAVAAPLPFPFRDGDRSRGLAGAVGFVTRCVSFDKDRGVADDDANFVFVLNPFPFRLVDGRAALGRSSGREDCCGGKSGRDTDDGDDLRGTLGAGRCRISSSALRFGGADSPPEMEARRSPIGIVEEIHGLAPVKPDGKDSPRQGMTVRQHQNGSDYLDTSGDDAERLGKSRKQDRQVDQQAA